jgi:hypothetical protein
VRLFFDFDDNSNQKSKLKANETNLLNRRKERKLSLDERE